MTASKCWEGRAVYANGDANGNRSGWVEAYEMDAERVRIVLRRNDLSDAELVMTRDQAKAFSGHLLSIAGRRAA